MMVFMVISLFLVKTLLAQWFDPEHAELEANKRLIKLSSAVDSLAYEVDLKDQFINNLTMIIKGDDTVDIQNNGTSQSLNELNAEIDLDNLPPIDSQFRKEFEEGGDLILDLASYNSENFRSFSFFRRFRGLCCHPIT